MLLVQENMVFKMLVMVGIEFTVTVNLTTTGGTEYHYIILVMPMVQQMLLLVVQMVS